MTRSTKKSNALLVLLPILLSLLLLGCNEDTPEGPYDIIIPVPNPYWSYGGLESERISVILPDPEDPEALLVGSMSNFNTGKIGGVFHTTDRCATWDTLFYGGSITDIKIDPNDHQRLFISSTVNGLNPPGLFKSENYGETWDTLGLPDGLIDWIGPSSISINPENTDDLLLGVSGIMGGGMFRSLDGGYHWEAVPETTFFLAGVTEITRHPSIPSIVYAGTADIGALFKSLDYGETWQRLYLSELWIIYAIEMMPDSPDTVVVGSSGEGVWITFDGGASWSAWNEGINEKSLVPSISLSPWGTVYAAVQPPDGLSKIYEADVSAGEWRQVGDFVSTMISTVALGADGAIYAGSYWMMVYYW